MNDDIALGYVLGTLDEEESARAEQLLATDPAFGAEVDSARLDIESLRTGINLVAARSAQPHVMGKSRLVALVAAAAMLAGVVVFAATRNDGSLTPGPGPSLAVPVPGASDLKNLVRDSTLIVTGTVVKVMDGRAGAGEGALAYRIAEVEISETIKGRSGATIAAFDYTYGTPWVEEGEHVLLFLLASEGTLHDAIRPPHFQVLNGDAGSYQIKDGSLIVAPFTLDDVRRAARG